MAQHGYISRDTARRSVGPALNKASGAIPDYQTCLVTPSSYLQNHYILIQHLLGWFDTHHLIIDTRICHSLHWAVPQLAKSVAPRGVYCTVVEKKNGMGPSRGHLHN